MLFSKRICLLEDLLPVLVVDYCLLVVCSNKIQLEVLTPHGIEKAIIVSLVDSMGGLLTLILSNSSLSYLLWFDPTWNGYK